MIEKSSSNIELPEMLVGNLRCAFAALCLIQALWTILEAA